MISCIGLVYSLILSIVNWCFDPAMDHHQGDGNSLRHRVASCYSSHSEVLFGTTAPHWRRRGLISQSRFGLTNCHTRNEVKTPAAMGGSDSATWPGISINNHANCGKTYACLVPATLKCSFAQPPLTGGGEGLFHSLEFDPMATRETR